MGQPEFVGHVQNQTTRNQIGKIQIIQGGKVVKGITRKTKTKTKQNPQMKQNKQTRKTPPLQVRKKMA